MPSGQQFVLQDIRCRVADDQLEPRTDTPETAHHVRQEIGTQCRARPEPDRAAQTFPAGMRQSQQRFGLFHNVAGMLQDLATARRQNSTTLPTLHKCEVERGFQAQYLLAERRLADPHPFRGLAVMASLRQGDEISQLPKRHLLLHDLSLSTYQKTKI